MIRKANECSSDVRHEMRGGPGDVTMVALLKEEELLGKGRLFNKIILPPGAGIGYHVHENESEIFLVNKGTPLYNDNGEEHMVAEGDVLITPPGAGHSITNTTDSEVELTALILFA